MNKIRIECEESDIEEGRNIQIEYKPESTTWIEVFEHFTLALKGLGYTLPKWYDDILESLTTADHDGTPVFNWEVDIKEPEN